MQEEYEDARSCKRWDKKRECFFNRKGDSVVDKREVVCNDVLAVIPLSAGQDNQGSDESECETERRRKDEESVEMLVEELKKTTKKEEVAEDESQKSADDSLEKSAEEKVVTEKQQNEEVKKEEESGEEKQEKGDVKDKESADEVVAE
ncbi:ENTH domain-containing protein C19F8.03c-like [Helianthus annuus]|uniref:ENTH domain-containing protein C19F8.03c-like n=1 Tax=Helianthus annuus TaxID=4232 RepID=UPI000B909E0F|nr:ENTH domain-containing protein C19F8.03c-like [Helianthus annuus]